MNSTIDLDSSNEGENLNPNIALIKPKREKGVGEKLGDTIELSSDEESEISITEEKKPILKRSRAAFNSTKNETLPKNILSLDANESHQTPYQTPQASTPATGYKSVVTSTPAETPRSKLSYNFKSSEEICDDDGTLSNDDSSAGTGSADSSSTTEEADEKQNLTNSDEDSTGNNESIDNNIEENEKSVNIKECNNSPNGLRNSEDDDDETLDQSEIGLDNEEKLDNEILEKEQREKQHETENITAIGNERDKVMEEDTSPKLFHHQQSSEINVPKSDATSEKDKTKECPPPESVTSTLTENDIEREKPRLLDLSTSGEETDIEDDIITKGRFH